MLLSTTGASLGHDFVRLLHAFLPDLRSVFYLCLALICYSLFGQCTADSFLENLGRDLSLQLLPSPVSFAVSLVSLVSMSIKLMVTLPLFAAPILASLENTLTLAHFGSRIVLKLFLVLVTAGLCILLKTKAVLVVEIVGTVPQNYACIVLPCATLLKLRWAHLTVVQRGMLFTLTVAFACYGIGDTVVSIVHAVSG